MKAPGTWTFETITPDRAQDYLSKMGKNRNLSRVTSNRIAEDIRNGKWEVTHQGLAFNCDGSLRDGQHRLQAIIDSEMAVDLWVYRGLPDSAAALIDFNRPRSACDAAVFVGQEMNKRQAPVANRMWMGASNSTHTRTMSKRGLIDFFVKHKTAIDWALEHLPYRKGLTPAPVVSAVARAYYFVDHRKLASFCKAIVDGVCDDEGRRTVIGLRDALMRNEGYGGSVQRELYLKTQRAIVAFMKGENLSRIYEASSEQFLIDSDSF